MALFRALKEQPPFDLSGSLGLGILCLLISLWLHLIFFIAWQRLAPPDRNPFHFSLESETPAIELALSVNDEAELEGPPEEQEALDAPEEYMESAGAGAGPEPEAEEEAAANPDPPLRVETEAPRFKSYYTAIRSAINQRWVLPPEAKTRFKPSRLTCDFTIARDGSLLRIVVIESSGSATLDHAGLEALRAAAPFPPFTGDLAAFSQLDIRMQFDYQARYVPR